MSYVNSLESEEQERKLFVGGLNKAVTDEDRLKTFFKEFGAIIDCTIMRDGDKQSRGFGFVLFEKSTSVDDIIASKKDGGTFTLDDYHIEVKRALPKVPGGTAGTSRTGGLYRKIFVGGLPSTISEEDLTNYFQQFGRVNEVELLRCRETNRLRGFAFVTFDDEDCADKCIQRRTHEICKKVCEVKRAQTRSNLTRFDDDGRGSGGHHGGRDSYHDRGDRSHRGGHHNNGPPHHQQQGNQSGASGLSMSEVNQLIQQAFAMGQQSVLQPTAVQPPTASSLLGLNSGGYSNNVQNTLLQALMSQHQAPAPVQAPIAPLIAAPPASAAASNAGAINQLAQLLNGRGIDPNTLSALLKQDQDPARPSATPAKAASSNGYATTYPPTTAYDLYYNQQGTSNYGPTKEDESKRGYRPY